MQAQEGIRGALAEAMTQVGGVPFLMLEMRRTSGIDDAAHTQALGSRVCTGNCQEAPPTPKVWVRHSPMTKNPGVEIIAL